MKRTRIPRRRQKPRRKRPELTVSRPKVEHLPWPVISIRLREKWWEQEKQAGRLMQCGICLLPIIYYHQLVVDHIEPGKMGGCKDNSEANLQPAHWWCNFQKGSKRTA